MAETVETSTAPVTLLATGPLTNVALFLARYPELYSRLDRLVIMGGSTGPGNINGVAEFNVWCDPEAAYRVLTDRDRTIDLDYNYWPGCGVADHVGHGKF